MGDNDPFNTDTQPKDALFSDFTPDYMFVVNILWAIFLFEQ